MLEFLLIGRDGGFEDDRIAADLRHRRLPEDE